MIYCMNFVSDLMQLFVTLAGLLFDGLSAKLDEKALWYAIGALVLVFLLF